MTSIDHDIQLVLKPNVDLEELRGHSSKKIIVFYVDASYQ